MDQRLIQSVLARGPLCAVCNVPVEEWEIDRDPMNRDTRFIARCHGAEQLVVLSEQTIESSGGNIELGLAFKEDGRKLPPAKLELGE